jgi:hypothetical protein
MRAFPPKRTLKGGLVRRIKFFTAPQTNARRSYPGINAPARFPFSLPDTSPFEHGPDFLESTDT